MTMNNLVQGGRLGWSGLVTILAAWALCVPLSAHAENALLYLSPPSAVVTIGETFVIDVMLDTDGDTINAAEGTVSFRESDVTVLNIDSSDSIFSSWLVEPTLEGETITFSGATNSQGYEGSDGRIMRLTLRALRNTNSQVWFSQGAAVMAADGRASNILSQLRSGTYTFTSREVVPALAQVTSVPEGSSSFIRSATHADQSKWYATTTAIVSWEVNESVTAVRTLLNEDPNAMPTKVYEEPLSSLRITDLTQGTSYFHLQLLENGVWGPVYHYALNVDSEAPTDLVVTEESRGDATDPNRAFAVSALDAMSGVARFEMSVDGGKPVVWNDDEETGLYRPIVSMPGAHMLEVAAIDRAGNVTSTTVTFTVDALDPPQVSEIPDRLQVGDALTVRGTTYPNADVVLSIVYDGREPELRTVSADGAGNFVATAVDPVRAGEYVISLVAENERGAKSAPMTAGTVIVSQPTLLLFGNVAVSYLTVVLSLVGALVLLGVFVWMLWALVRRLRGRVGKESAEAEAIVHESFADLSRDVSELVAMLRQTSRERRLTQEEQMMFATLSQHLHEAEEAIIDEIDDIPVATRIAPRSIKVTKVREG